MTLVVDVTPPPSGRPARRGLPRAVSTVVPALRGVLIIAALLALWELLARGGVLTASVPPFLSTVRWLAQNWGDYEAHVTATFSMAGKGLLLGSAIAVLSAIVLCLVPSTESSIHGVLVAAYCAPSVVVLPILGAATSVSTTRLTLVCAMIIYPVCTSTLVGLRSVDRHAVEVISAYGGGRLQVLARLRLPNAIPNILAGLQIAVPASIVATMVAELAGGRWGLGLYLVAGLKDGNANLVWGVALLVTSVSCIGFSALGACQRWVERRRAQVTAHETTVFADLRAGVDRGGSRMGRVARRAGQGLLGIAVPLLLWWWVVRVADMNPILVKGPGDVWSELFGGPRAPANRRLILDAIGSSLLHAAAGVLAGLAAALVLAIILDVWPRLRGVLLPVALVSQTVPLMALVPILILTVGRGFVTMMLIGVSVTFFPAFVMISTGLAGAPRPLVEVVQASSGTSWSVIRRVKLPYSIPYLTAALRLLAPRGLLAIFIAEYIAIGSGIGFLVYTASGVLNFGLMWAAAVVVVVLSCTIFWLAGVAERAVFRRFAGVNR